MRRHDLVFVDAAAWRAQIATCDELAADRIVATWAEHRWPLVCRRASSSDGIALGLPLPGKRRLSFVVRREDIISTSPPPSLAAASRVAPRAWWSTLAALHELAVSHGVEARVFGSLAWQTLTGLCYLTAGSDLDLLLHIEHDTDARGLVGGLAEIEESAPMRIDGELMRSDGAAVSWRELHVHGREILVKTVGGVALLDAERFLLGMSG